MKSTLITSIALLALTACASNGTSNNSFPELVNAKLQAGKFVEFTCDTGRFSARLAQDNSSIRVRTIHGSAELERQADATWSADGFVLTLAGANGTELTHSGKAIGKNCKPQM